MAPSQDRDQWNSTDSEEDHDHVSHEEDETEGVPDDTQEGHSDSDPPEDDGRGGGG